MSRPFTVTRGRFVAPKINFALISVALTFERLKSIIEEKSRVVIGQKLGWLRLLTKGTYFAVARHKGLVNIRWCCVTFTYSQNFV